MSEDLVTCAHCGTTGFTARGLKAHRCKGINRNPASDLSPAPDLLGEILELAGEVRGHIRRGCADALRVGLRLIALHRATGESAAPGGFHAALAELHGIEVHKCTCYRWMNAAAAALCRAHDVSELSDVFIPPAGTMEWNALEGVLRAAADGMSLRRLALGWRSPASDEARLERLVSDDEAGDPHAADMLEKVSAGELTLAQAIRGATGAAATKDKHRRDPIYLDIDSATGQPAGLVPKCLVTLSNAFDCWAELDETARSSMRPAWKALVAKLPPELK